MRITRKISRHVEIIRRLELCPSLLNLDVEKYSFSFLLNDIFSGLKMFLILFPIALALALYCGVAPVQGIISCAIASFCSAVLGGSRYQISIVALPLCTVMFEILAKYQYRGLFFVAMFASLMMIVFGLLRLNNVLKYLSGSFVAAITVSVCIAIVINQFQYILSISTVQSSQSIIENLSTFMSNTDMITFKNVIQAVCFLLPLIIIRKKIKSHFSFFLYMCLGVIVGFASDTNLLPSFLHVKTTGHEFLNSQLIDNITTLAKSTPSDIFLANTLSYAFVISIIIALECCFCTHVAGSVTGDKKLYGNAEMISSGISNLLSVACGGLFVSPSIAYTMKNISFKTKTIVGTITITILSILFLMYSYVFIDYIPVYCISAILIAFAISTIRSKKILQYFDYRNNETYIFWATVLATVFFGFIPAVIIGFTTSMVFFGKRMVKIKDAVVHTTRKHDSGTIEFMLSKNGFLKSKKIPDNILKQIHVIQVDNILCLNIAKIIEEDLRDVGQYPKVQIVYFKNVPFLDGEALNLLKTIVKKAKKYGSIVIVSGTNGMLLDILQQKESQEKTNNAFGYIVPNFESAIKTSIDSLKEAQ